MGKSWKKRAKKAVKKQIGLAKKALGYATGGQFGGKSESGDSYAPAPTTEYALKDVARSRAAGSGVFNYTDQEMKPK